MLSARSTGHRLHLRKGYERVRYSLYPPIPIGSPVLSESIPARRIPDVDTRKCRNSESCYYSYRVGRHVFDGVSGCTCILIHNR